MTGSTYLYVSSAGRSSSASTRAVIMVPPCDLNRYGKLNVWLSPGSSWWRFDAERVSEPIEMDTPFGVTASVKFYNF